MTTYIGYTWRNLKKFLRGYVTVAGRQRRVQQSKLAQRSAARKILLDFVAQGEIAEVLIKCEGTVVTMSDGRRYWWDPDDNVRRMFTVSVCGDFETNETKFLRSTIRPGDVVLDVGANFGWYTFLFSQLVGDTGQVHAFEPIPRNLAILRENHQLNGSLDRVYLNHQAIGANIGELTLYLPDIGSSGSFQLHHYESNYQEHVCPVVTLDSYVQQHHLTNVRLIKADIEGAELDMLRGATNLLNAVVKPIWLLEVQEKSTHLFGYTPRDVFDLMSEYGYVSHVVGLGGRLTRVMDMDVTRGYHNFVFIAE